MSTLNSALHSNALAYVARQPSRTPRPNLMARASDFLRAIERKIEVSARSKRESNVSKFLAENGGHVTDDIEREMSRRFGGIVGG